MFPAKIADDAIFLSREDASHPLATFSPHSFSLDGADWPSLEHYFQAAKFSEPGLRLKIARAPTPDRAQKIARRYFWRRRKDWKKIQLVVMTRGVYIKCRTHGEVASALAATGERQLVEASLYDHYWGCGRDQLGHNYYGRVLMDVRKKLGEEYQPQ